MTDPHHVSNNTLMTYDMFKAIFAVVCKKFIDTREVHERVVKDQRELSALEKLAVDPERRKYCLIYSGAVGRPLILYLS